VTSRDDSAVPDYESLLRLDGRNLIVVGAGQGMGRQTSHALASCGARVLCVDIDGGLAHEIAAEVEGIPWVGDATKGDDVARLVADASMHFDGAIHGFVDIVGMAQWSGVLELDEVTWDQQFDICLRHAYLLGHHVGRHMVERGTRGTMVFIASLHAFTASARHAAYGAAKAGLVSWVRTLAHELGGYGIRANAIAPGSILTPRIALVLDEDRRQKAAALAPLRRMGLPPDIASTALFFTSDLSSYITGQTLLVDGGVLMQDPYEPL
jgi:NAD(P)-dependent dehydrogenase (short-subunit alcohol dehydrogenase family)